MLSERSLGNHTNLLLNEGRHDSFLAAFVVPVPDISQNLASSQISLIADLIGQWQITHLINLQTFRQRRRDMKVKALEKTTRTWVTTKADFEQVYLFADKRGLLPKELLLVIGEPNVQLHNFSKQWADTYAGLLRFLWNQHAQEYVIEAARARHAIWDKITCSLEVDDEFDVAPPLAATVGVILARDVELALIIDRMIDGAIFGPDTRRSWMAAYRYAGIRSKSFRKRYVLAIHEALGLICVAPEEYFAERHTGFIVKKVFEGAQ